MTERFLVFLLLLIPCMAVSAQAATITSAEYYFDEDPGEGFGFSMDAADGAFDSSEEALVVTGVSTSGLSAGSHTVYVRAQISEGKWSAVASGTMVVTEAFEASEVTIVKAECYFDEDPGEGFGFSMDAADGWFDSSEEELVVTGVSTSGLSAGSHTVYVRARTSDGKWSAPFSQALDVREELNTVVAAEYYMDEDPGVGRAIPMQTEDGHFDEPNEALVAAAIPTEDLTLGTHVVGIRSRDAQGVWSETTINTFEVIRPQRPVVVLSDTAHTFGPVLVGVDTTWTLTVSNPGVKNLIVRSMKVSGEGFSAELTSFTVSSGGSVSVAVDFAPANKGQYTGTLTMQTNDPERPEAVVHLSGSGVSLNMPPSIALTAPKGRQSGDVILSYRLSDPENDTLSIVCEYKWENVWKSAAIFGKQDSISSIQYIGSVVWQSGADLPEAADSVAIRITPRDRDVGIADTVFVFLDNLGLPSIQLSDLSGEQEGQVQISYTITDEEYDPIALFCEYSTDSGRTYKAATVTGKTAGIDSSGYVGSVLWESAADLPGIDRTTVRFRITPSDAHTGIADETHDFHLDNNRPPSVVLSELQGEQTEDIPIRYTLSDAEGDTLTIRCAYSRDGEAWFPATIMGDTVVAQSRYTGQIVWRSLVDLPNVNGKAYFRISPLDKDPGESGVLPLQVDNIRAAITLLDPVGEQTGDVTIRYLIGNESGGPVNLECTYSDDSGATWHWAMVEGDTAGIDSTRYRGSLVWKSSADLPGVDKGTVRLRITPRDVRTGIPDETEDFHLDNNAPPSVVLRDVPDLQTGSIGIGYTLPDAEHDSLSLRCEVWDAGASAWVDAAVLSPTEHILNYEGEIVWDTGKDLPEKAVSVLFRITPSDHDPGTADTTVVFVDNVTPSIFLTDPEGDQSGDVVIGFVIANDTLSVVSLGCAYSEDGGSSWKAAMVEGDTSGIDSDGYAGEVVWASKADLPDRDVETVRFRITPRDGLHVGASVQTSVFHVDNLPPTSLTASGTFGGTTIGLRFNEAVEQASAETVGHYELSHGLTASSAVFVAPDSVVLTLDPGQVLPFEEVTLTIVGVKDVLGNEVVTSLRTTFEPVNTPPVATLEDVVGEVSGEVTIQYELSDVDGNLIHLRCAYSVDGISWHSATVVGDTLIRREGYDGFVIWRSQVDLPGMDRSAVRFRITPFDGEPGAPGITVPFHLDNNRPPSVTVQEVEGTQTGNVLISYALSDEESDPLDLLCQFSVDGTSWQPATVEGDTADIGSTAYTGELLWRSSVDLEAFVGTVSFRVIPRDQDQGTGDVITIVVDYVAPTIEVEDVTGEQSGDVEISYSIVNEGTDPVSLYGEYSEDGGVTWSRATVKGDTSGIGPMVYAGSLVWASGSDLPGFDGTSVRFRITPRDAAGGRPGQTPDFHLDTTTSRLP